MKITWLGHSGFRIEIERAVLLIDPWLHGNPVFPKGRETEAVSGATHALSIAKEAGIPIACIHELSELFAADGAGTIGFGKGGTIDLNGATVSMVNACHSASIDFKGGLGVGGSEAGFMIAGEGHTIYISGDTTIMADMGWMGEYYKPDIGILCAGGHYTMDMKMAAWAAKKYFDFRTLIPCHYKTFPILAKSAEDLKAALPGVNVVEPEVFRVIEV